VRRMSLGGGVLMWARKRGDGPAGEGMGTAARAAGGRA
jgi:hypothetical protein